MGKKKKILLNPLSPAVPLALLCSPSSFSRKLKAHLLPPVGQKSFSWPNFGGHLVLPVNAQVQKWIWTSASRSGFHLSFATERQNEDTGIYNVCLSSKGGTILFVHSRDGSDPKCLIGHNKGDAEGIHIQMGDICHRARSCSEGRNKKIDISGIISDSYSHLHASKTWIKLKSYSVTWIPWQRFSLFLVLSLLDVCYAYKINKNSALLLKWKLDKK